jgi:hypothetical protein
VANPSGHFRQSDVTRWGMIALVCGAIAVLSANLSALLPPTMLSSLHKTRIGGASLEQLRAEVAQLSAETVRLRRENGTLLTRFTLQERANSQTDQRVRSLEVSVPNLLEALPAGAQIDREALTASAGEPAGEFQQADGGYMRVWQSPLAPQPSSASQPLPEPLAETPAATASEGAFGVAVGGSVETAQAMATWRELQTKVAPLLVGLTPLLSLQSKDAGARIVAGPLTAIHEARTLCERLQEVAIACSAAPYAGTPL